MSKVRVLVKNGVAPFQVDGFPAGCERSCEGSLRLAPGLVVMTQDEWAFILKKKHQARGLILHSRIPDPKPAPVAPPVVAEPVTVPAEVPQVATEDEEPAEETVLESSLADTQPETKKRKRDRNW